MISIFLFLLFIQTSNGFISKEIPRISAPSVKTFIQDYAMKGIPVIITNYSDVFQNMTEQNIIETCGKKWVSIAKTRNTTLDKPGSKHRWANVDRSGGGNHLFKIANDIILGTNEEDQSYYGVFDWPLSRNCPEVLKKYYKVPKYIAQDFMQRVPKEVELNYRDSWPSFFLAQSNSYGGLHRDVFGSAFWQYVISGKKEWHVLSPFLNLEDINLVEPSHVQYTAIVEAGEFIYIPGNSPHQVKNIGKTSALAGNMISIDSFPEMEKEITGSYSSYYMQLQKTLLQPDFDRSFNWNQEDITWDEFKNPKLKPRQKVIIHTYIVNLEHRQDRYKKLYNILKNVNLPIGWELDINRINASTGNEDYVSTYSDWQTNEIFHDGKVRETAEYWLRPVTKGEIGCYMSHVTTILDKIAPYNTSGADKHYFLMLEDDANFNTFELFFDIKKRLHELPKNWDLFYLGYAFVNDAHRKVNENIYQTGYTYQTHAYMITQEAAIKMAQIENIYDNIVAYDEFLTSIHKKHPREDMNNLYELEHEFNFYASDEKLVWQRKVHEGGDNLHDSSN